MSIDERDGEGRGEGYIWQVVVTCINVVLSLVIYDWFFIFAGSVIYYIFMFIFIYGHE